MLPSLKPPLTALPPEALHHPLAEFYRLIPFAPGQKSAQGGGGGEESGAWH